MPLENKAKSSRRGAGRGAQRKAAPAVAVKQTPWTLPVNPDAPTEPLSEDGVQALHDGAMRVLENIGIDFINEESKSIL